MTVNLYNIYKYNKISKIIDIINNLLKDKKYEEAYYKAAAILEFINANLIMKKYNIKLQDTNLSNVIDIYSKKDEELFKQMISINGTYNMIEKNNISDEDVEYLLIKIDGILGYIIEKYGDIIE